MYDSFASFQETSILLMNLQINISAHGELECVVLHLRSVTISSVTTLINNSPNLISLHIFIQKPPMVTQDYDYAHRIKAMFSCQELSAGGSINVHIVDDKKSKQMVQDALMNTNLNPLWVSVV